MIPFTEEHRLLRETVRKYANDKLAPRAIELDQQKQFPHEAVKEMGELGLLGAYFPEEYGGSGMDFVTFIIGMEEINRVCGNTGITYTAHTSLCMAPIADLGTEEQKKKYLPPLASGEHIGCFGLSEPEAGSDAGNCKTTAIRDGDHYVVNGAKQWITNAREARTMVATVKTDPSQGRSRGISALIVDMQTPGVSVPKVEDKLGLRGSSTGQVFLDNVHVPAENLLGEENTGFGTFMQTLEGGRVGIGAMALGLAQGAFERSVAYMKERKTFDKLLAQHQALQFALADMATEIEAARLLVYRAAFMKAAGQPFGKEAAMAKLYASEVAMRATEMAIQIHGGYGYTVEYEVERIWRDAKLCTIGEGASEILRMVIARQILGRATKGEAG
ncbi:acyl-CoA dehydrogenase [bacterium]|nr:acyl-CoA dehydrogenase [bacterium]